MYIETPTKMAATYNYIEYKEKTMRKGPSNEHSTQVGDNIAVDNIEVLSERLLGKKAEKEIERK